MNDNYNWKDTIASFASLFASTSTLLCCALPALLVTIGAGASLAGLVSSAPWLVTFSKYKAWTFSVSGLLLLFAGYLQYKGKKRPCPIDPEQAKACMKLRKISIVIYFSSVFIWLTGFFFAFIAARIFY